MQFQTQAILYCERGSDLNFWAEPLNAVTNGAFILAAFASAFMIGRRPQQERSGWQIFFVLNLFAIGAGSFLFHTMPGINTAAADTGPIGIFMLAYLVFAMRRLAGASWFLTAAGVAAFIGSLVIAFNIQCWDGRIGFLLDNVPAGARARCFNGGLGYAPAALSLILMSVWLQRQGHAAVRLILAAALVFAMSLTLRSVDLRFCGDWVIMGHRMGTHFIWHLLNAATLYLLVLAAIRYEHDAQRRFTRNRKPEGAFAVS